MNYLMKSCWATLVLLLFLLVRPIYSQDSTANVMLIGFSAGEISFYTVDANGSLQVVGKLPDTFSTESATSHWWIPSEKLFAISPTGERIAFSAKKGPEYSVFIYNVSQNNFQQINVGLLALPLWSPDSKYLFLEPRYVNTNTSGGKPHIYDLELNSLYELPQLDHTFFNFQWKPDSSGLIFQGYAGDNCSTYCVEIFSFNLDTQIMKQLTTVEDDLPVNLFPLTCYPTFSNMDYRIYYAVGCIEVGIDPLDYLYSVDTDGNETQVINFLELGEDVIENDIASINNMDSTIVIAYQATYGGSNGSIHWLIDSVDETANVQNLLDITFDGFRPKLYESQLSPNKSHMVLVGLTPPNGIVAHVGDLISGEINYTIYPSQGNVCRVHWLSDVELIFEVTEANCFHEEYEYSGSLFYHLNIDTEIVTEISSEDQLWIISSETIEEGASNETPTPSTTSTNMPLETSTQTPPPVISTATETEIPPTDTPLVTPSETMTETPLTPTATPTLPANAPVASINDVSTVEGTGGTTDLVFTVSLSAPTTVDVTVNYTVSAVSASAGKDYGVESPQGSLVIPANSSSGIITVPIIADTYAEPTETFEITLTSAINAALATGDEAVGVGTITNDDRIVGDFSTSGDGSECTEINFDAALVLAGNIPFDCPAETTIPITSVKTISPLDVSLNGNHTVTLDGGDTSRLIAVTNNLRTVTIQNITLANGYGSSLSGALVSDGATVYLDHVTITGSSNGGTIGGAVSNNGGKMYITNSTFSDNTLNVNGGNGGAIFSSGPNAELNILGSTFINNTSNGNNSNRGGAVQINGGVSNIANSTFINNQTSGIGGAIRPFGAGVVVNITNSTFSGNGAVGGGSAIGSSSATVTLRNSIMTNSTAGTHCNASISDGTGNVIHGSTCSGITAASTQDPLLDSAVGSPLYLPLSAGSSAIDAVTNCTYLSTSGNPLFTDGNTVSIDQIGALRPQGSACDAGAFEYNGSTSTATPVTPTQGPSGTNTPVAPTLTPTPGSSDLIFADGFESGNLSGWSSSVADWGDLSVTSGASVHGSYGLQAVINDNNAMYVTDETPDAATRYRARFYFDPNSITMDNGDLHYIFYGYAGITTGVVRLEFRYSAGAYQIRAAAISNGSTWTNTSWFSISDAPHAFEIDWQASTSGSSNGQLTLWIDGTQQANLTGLTNDTRVIDRGRIGAIAAIDSGTRGIYYFDSFESRTTNYIGLVSP